MATELQKREFIKQMAACAKSSYERIGKILPSVAVAMSCVECAYGTAGSCTEHSYFGFKVGTGKTATKYWDGTYRTWKTAEETASGHISIKSAFRTYRSMQQACDNFYELLNTSLYKGVTVGDYKSQMRQIKACGYMTSSSETDTVIKIIERYGLTDLDNAAPKWKEPDGKENEIHVRLQTLKKGDKSPQVKGLQFILSSVGYKVSIDGMYGNNTFEAVKAFQKAYSLVSDGVCGLNTWTKLLFEFFHQM